MDISYSIDISSSDLESLAILSNSLFAEKSRFSHSDFIDMSNQKDIYLIAKAYKKDSSEIIGYFVSRQILDEAEIYQIGIKDSYQGQNIGKHLLEFSLNILKEMKTKKVYLEVRNNNNKAINLYQKVGFIKYGLRKNYYENNIDAYLYRKELI